MAAIRNPAEWTADALKGAAGHAGSMGRTIRGGDGSEQVGPPIVRPIEVADLKDALARGVDDFKTYRTDIIFLCLIYPAVGLLLAWFTFDYELLPLLFPVASGFALLGPVAAVGLYEMSRLRERGEKAGWMDAFGTLRSPSFGAIAMLGFTLLVLLLLWLGVANVIYDATLGPKPPASLAALLQDVFSTGAGWTMLIVGTGVGFLFAVLVLTISVVSFPLLLDRDVGLITAVKTSVQTVKTNPITMAVWGMIVACGLVIGSIPLLLGLIFVMPVLGHATWHLYRKVIGP